MTRTCNVMFEPQAALLLWHCILKKYDCPRFLEDLSVGETNTTGRVSVSANDIIEFAKSYDPQSMHMDPIGSDRFSLGGLIASGWHTAALVMRLLADSRLLGSTPLLARQLERFEALSSLVRCAGPQTGFEYLSSRGGSKTSTWSQTADVKNFVYPNADYY